MVSQHALSFRGCRVLHETSLGPAPCCAGFYNKDTRQGISGGSESKSFSQVFPQSLIIKVNGAILHFIFKCNNVKLHLKMEFSKFVVAFGVLQLALSFRGCGNCNKLQCY